MRMSLGRVPGLLLVTDPNRSERPGEVSHGPKAVSSLVMCPITQPCPTLCNNPWTVAHQAPLSMEFSRQERWTVLPFPPPGDPPNPRIEPTCPASPELADRLFTAMPPGESSLYERVLISASELLFRNFKSSRLVILEAWQLQRGNLTPKAHLLNPAVEACRGGAIPGSPTLPDYHQ